MVVVEAIISKAIVRLIGLLIKPTKQSIQQKIHHSNMAVDETRAILNADLGSLL